MLGLANTVSSSSTPESKYSLTFDGTDDYLNLNTLAAGLSLADNAAYSISLWFNTTDASGSAGTNILVGVNGTSNDNVLRLGVDVAADGIFFNGTADGNNNSSIGSVDYADGAWHHLMLSRPAGSGENTTFYVDGSSIGTSNHDILWSDTTLFFLGAEADAGTLGDFYEGKITDFAMWNVALDSDAVTAIYNNGKPTNLTLPLPDYDNQDVGALQGYWRMGNGLFDDKANGVVHDQFGNTGGDLVTGGDMSDTSKWSKGTGWDVNDTTSNKAVHANHSDDGGSTFDNLTQDIGAVPGRTYKVVFTVSGYGGSGFIRANVGGYNSGPNITANGTYTHIIKNNHALSNSTLYFSIEDSADATLDDVSVFEVAPGFGADEVTDGDFPSLDNWDELNEGGDNQVTLVDGTAKITYVTGSTTDPLGIRQSGILTIGNTYKITMDVVSISGNGVKFYSGTEHAASIGTGPHKSYFVADGEDFRIFRNSAGDSSVTTVDNIVIKQLNGLPGLTSGGPTFSSDTP